jgi:hypothetical protein
MFFCQPIAIRALRPSALSHPVCLCVLRRFEVGMGNGGFKQKQNEVDAERDPGRAEVEGVIRKTCSKVIARESDEAVNTLLAHATSEYASGARDQ